MKLEVTIHDWKHYEYKDVIATVANALLVLSRQDEFEQQCNSVKSPMWYVDNYGLLGIELNIRLRKDK